MLVRRFIVVLLALGLSGCLQDEQNKTKQSTAAGPAAKKVYTLTLAQSWPRNLPIMGSVPDKLAAMVKTMSDGRLLIRVDDKNKHKAALGVFDMVKAGQYDMGHSASFFWKGKDPNTLYFTTMPFGMTSMEQYAWFYYGDGFELMQKVYAPHGMLSFPGGNTGSQMGGWFQKEINTINDLDGLKIRIPGFAGEVLARVGAKPTNIPAGELYTALERRTVDAVEWAGPSMDLQMGFHKIAPFYYTGWQEPGSELQYLINQQSWQKLPADLQEILRVAMRLTAYDMYAEATVASGENLQKMKTDYPHVQIKSFPAEVILALKQATDELVAERTAADPLAAEIIASQQAYQSKVREWTKISDLAYLLMQKNH